MGTNNKQLNVAKNNKMDEFYTQLKDIELELCHYEEFFKDKIVLCNCDNPFESNFFKYFVMNFNHLGLKKLICTCYDGSPVDREQLSLFDFLDYNKIEEKKAAYKIEITEVEDFNSENTTDIYNVESLVKNKKNILTKLNGNGDFRSQECLEILKESDIVVTNPPFSLFREYVDILMKYKKKFLILGNINALTYLNICPYIIKNELYLGVSIHSGDREFKVPENYPLSASISRIDNEGKKYIRVKGVRWITNLANKNRHNFLVLNKKFSPEEYPKYINYDAINVDKTSDIPEDYYGCMGVPITFLDKYNPDQFEIISFKYGDDGKILAYMKDGKRIYPYFRIIIRRKKNNL